MLSRHELNQLFRYGCSLTDDRDRAYDLLQGAIEACLETSFDEVHNRIAYIKRIMRNRFIDEFRHEQKFPSEAYDDNSPVSLDESALEDIVIAEHDLELVWNMLDVTEREILFYWAVEGRTASEIATILQTTRGTVLSRIHRLRNRIVTTLNSDRVAGGYDS